MKFYITFSQKYRHETHPLGAHPDGWFEVEAKDQDEAAVKANDALGAAWSFIYPRGNFDETRFPLGKLGEIK